MQDNDPNNSELPVGEDPFVMGGVASNKVPTSTPITMTTMVPSDSNNTPAVTIDTTISSMIQSNHNDDNTTNNQNYSDPGRIATSPHRQSQSQINNITISANDIKKELEDGDYIGQTDYINNNQSKKNDNAITAFINKTFNVVESSQNNRTSAMESQIIEQHSDYMRRFKGYPSDMNNSSIAAAASSFHPEPCTGGKFLVTKLRNWRTGYERILSLHQSYFTTVDPETNEITNLWKYTQVKQCLPLQNKEDDCISLDIFDENGRSSTKLKFKCRPNCRQEVLISFVKCKYLNDLQIASGNSGGGNSNVFRLQKQLQEQNPLFECQRLTRHGIHARIQTLLVCAPHGLVEIDSQSRTIPIQTYPYTRIRSICFIGDEGTGIVFYIGGINSIPLNSSTILNNINQGNNNHNSKIDPGKDKETICEEKVFLITSSIRAGGSGRSDLVTILKLKFDLLGLPLQFSESVRLESLIQNKMNKGRFAGGCIGMFPVMKVSQRRECFIRKTQQQQQATTDESVEPCERFLVLTQNGYILECEDDKRENSEDLIVINCRKLRDIASLIRHSHHTNVQSDTTKLNDVQNLFSIEYKDRLCRTYSSPNRDTIMTSILDSTVNLCRNYNATVTDVSTLGYSFISLETPWVSGSVNKSNEAGIFQSDPVEVICLRRVQSIAITTNFYMDICLSPQNDKGVCDDDCIAIAETCREFNMNVSLSGIRNLPDDQNVIIVSINNLWGIVSKLMTIRHNQSYSDGKEKQINGALSMTTTDGTLTAILQTLYRLMLTPHGYTIAIDDEVAMNVFSSMMSMITDLPLYWSLKCASALLLPRPFSIDRELEIESKNKTTLLRRIPDLVAVLIGNSQSTLILMVVSNMLESILCSHNESTDTDDFTYITDRLAEGYPKLMQLLYSEASVIVENTALLLYILEIHSSKTASMVKEVALNSGLLLQHFYHAIFNSLDCQRFLSRFLCSLWFAGSSATLEKQLLARMIPSGFFSYLSMPKLSDTEEDQLDHIQSGFDPERKLRYKRGATSYGSGTNINRLRERIKISSKRDSTNRTDENFRIFFHVLKECHSIPDLIWNQTTRQELKCALEKELQSIQEEINRIGGMHKIAWNHQQFKVIYPSLEREVKVGTIYLQLWLNTGDSFIKSWRNPLRLFELLFRRFLCELDRDHTVTNMCIRCLDRLYGIHSTKIGPFPDIMFLMRSMMETSNMETQHRLLHLISSLVGGNPENEYDDRSNLVQNAEQLLNIESFSTLCSFVSLGHLSTKNDHTGPPSETDGNSPKTHPIWVYVERDQRPTRENIKGPFTVNELSELYLRGQLQPSSLLRTVHSKGTGTISNMNDNFFSHEWKKLNDIWQLRWSLVLTNSSSGVYTQAELSSIALNCLLSIVSAHQSVDSRGIAYVPVPIGKRLLCEDSGSNLRVAFISTISQILLCGQSTLITTATSIIMKAMEHHDKACANLYLTGIFYFAFTNLEDNVFEKVITLVHRCHLKQNCGSVMGSCRGVRELSVLANVLPHGLFNVLVNTDAQKFSEVFSGSFDTPEVVWNPQMKKYLQSTIEKHLGDFPLRLRENMMEQYDFCPIPRVTYAELEGDLFCHRYYLKNLCDEELFADWPVSNPSEVFTECLSKLIEVTNSNDAQNKEELFEESRKLLGLESNYNAEHLRQAYCNLAKACYNDKTEMFEKVQSAYDRLSCKRYQSNDMKLRKYDSPLSEDDAIGLGIDFVQMQSVYLLLKTQLLICKRYSSELILLKYPAYGLLFSCLNFNPKNSEEHLEDTNITDLCLVRLNRLEFTRTVVDLIFNTCLVSPSNAEELVKSNGLVYLESQFDFYIEALESLAAEVRDNECIHKFNLTAEIIIHIVHTIAGVAFFDFGRSAILALKNCQRLCANWRKCLGFNFPHGQPLGINILRQYALEGIASMSKHAKLQEILIGSHVVWPLINSMLAYDPLTETTPMISEVFESSISKAESNVHAFLATRALGMLCGVMKDDFATPQNGMLFNAMRNVLTQPFANMLSNSQSNELLMTLNLNVESPLRLWDEKMRSELRCFVHEMDEMCRSEGLQGVDEALSASRKFEYSNLSNEVNIGGVYIRIFNRMDVREAIQNLPDGSSFVIALLEFIGRSMHNSPTMQFTFDEYNFAEDSVSVENHWFPVTDNRFTMAVLSVRQLVQLDGVVDDILCTSTGIMVLFELITIPQPNEAHDIGHEILQLMSTKKFFADAVGNYSKVIRKLVSTVVFQQLISNSDNDSNIDSNDSENFEYTKWLEQKWSILESLAKSPVVAGALVKSSVWLELLGVISCYDRFSSISAGRMGAARTLARLLWDPITTGTAGTLLQIFLPTSLLLILKEKGAELFLESYDINCENPELIWDLSMRKELRQSITEHLDPIIANGSTILEDFSVDSMFSLQYERLQSEIYVGGVYVKYFLQEPLFNLRDPSGFLENLMNRWAQTIDSILQGKGSSNVDNETSFQLLTEACKILCKHSYLSVKLSPWGYMKRSVIYLHAVIGHNLMGCPLKEIIEFLHFTSSERVNVESIIDVCDTNGKNGIVDGIMKAIRAGNPHPETALMLDTLKIIIKDALGYGAEKSNAFPAVEYVEEFGSSPAPGKESVKNMKKLDGDDPLSMLLGGGLGEQMHSNQTRPSVASGRNQQTTTNFQSRGSLNKTKQINTPTLHSGEPNHFQGSARRPMKTQPQRNLSNPLHQGEVMSQNRRSQPPGQYKHSTPTGRGVKPVRNQINNHTRNELNDPLSHHVSTRSANTNAQQTRRSHINQRSHSQVNHSSIQPANANIKPAMYQNNANINNDPYRSNPNGQHNLGNPQNQQYLHFQSSNNAIQTPNAQPRHSNLVIGGNVSQPMLTTYQPHPSPPVQGAHIMQQQQPQNSLLSNQRHTPPSNQTPYQMPQPPQQVHGEVQEPQIQEPKVDPNKVAEEKIKTSPGAPGCAKGRDALLSSILSCGFIEFLVKEVLVESSLVSVKESENVKVQAEEIMKLLMMDPGYGLKFQLILNELEYYPK